MEEKERQVKGIWIPIEIWKNEDLSWSEKILFLEIDSFTNQDVDCYISNNYIATLLGVSETTANKILSSLISKGYVVKTRFDGRHRYVRSALHFTTGQGCTKVQGRVDDNSNPIFNNNNINNLLIQTTNTKDIKEYKEKFYAFVDLYKKLTKTRTRGKETEFNDFSKRYRNWYKILPYLPIAIQRETNDREQAKSQGRFFPEPKLLQTYLGKQRAWEMYVTVGDDVEKVGSEYHPMTGGNLTWNDYYGCFMYMGMWNGKIPDGYTDEDRPDGASVTLSNGRIPLVWSSKTKKWTKTI